MSGDPREEETGGRRKRLRGTQIDNGIKTESSKLTGP